MVSFQTACGSAIYSSSATFFELMKMKRIVFRLNNHDKFQQQSQPGRDKTQPTNYHCISVHFSGWLGSGGWWGNRLAGIKLWEFGWQSGAPFTENKNIERHTACTIVWWSNTSTMANGSHFPFDDNHKIKYIFHNHHKRNGYAEYTQPHILHERWENWLNFRHGLTWIPTWISNHMPSKTVKWIYFLYWEAFLNWPCLSEVKPWVDKIGNNVCTPVANWLCALKRVTLVFISRVVQQRGK